MSVAECIKENKVVVFSWVHCPYCVKAKQILQPLAPGMKVYELDTMENGEAYRSQIINTYNHETVPAIFINGQFIGGCDDLQQLQKSGDLAAKLAAKV